MAQTGKNQESPNLFDESWIRRLMDKCDDAVLAYEDYLMDKMTARQLAIIMKSLRSVLAEKMDIDNPSQKQRSTKKK